MQENQFTFRSTLFAHLLLRSLAAQVFSQGEPPPYHHRVRTFESWRIVFVSVLSSVWQIECQVNNNSDRFDRSFVIWIANKLCNWTCACSLTLFSLQQFAKSLMACWTVAAGPSCPGQANEQMVDVTNEPVGRARSLPLSFSLCVCSPYPN